MDNTIQSDQAAHPIQLKAVVMDMDGTLLDPDNRIPEATRNYLIDLEKRGVRLVLASGRSYTRLLDYARSLDMDMHQGMLIEIDGVAIYDLDQKKRTKFRMMEPEEIYEVFDYLMTQDAESQAMFDDGLFDWFPDSIRKIKEQIRIEQNLSDDFPWTAGPWNWLTDFRDGYGDIRYIEKASQITRPVNKIQIMQEEKPLGELYERLQEKFGDQFSIYRTTPKQLEILPEGFSKGAALAKIMEQEGWNRDEVIVFGDGENDCSLFDEVSLSYAMGNAREYVKKHATRTALPNSQEGIRHALESLELAAPRDESFEELNGSSEKDKEDGIEDGMKENKTEVKEVAFE